MVDLLIAAASAPLDKNFFVSSGYLSLASPAAGLADYTPKRDYTLAYLFLAGTVGVGFLVSSFEAVPLA